MRSYNLEIHEKDTSRSLSIEFDTETTEMLGFRTFKTNPSGEFEVVTVLVDADDVEAIIEFLQTFMSENSTAERKKKGA
jgi:hypothetical protein